MEEMRDLLTNEGYNVWVDTKIQGASEGGVQQTLLVGEGVQQTLLVGEGVQQSLLVPCGGTTISAKQVL